MKLHPRVSAMLIRIRRGIDLAITGVPEQSLHAGAPVASVALVGPNYLGLEPTLQIQVGDPVERDHIMLDDFGG